MAERGRCALAFSGGTTPWGAFRALAGEDVPWDRVHLFQVDERVAPSGDPDRNDFHLKEALIDRIAIPSANVHSMPVDEEDLDGGGRRYESILRKIAGTPPVLDLVQLGLGEDGHTASLFPGDAALQVVDSDVAVSGLHMGRRRMTLTFPAIDRARCILWLVTGAGKAEALETVARRRPVHPGGTRPTLPRCPPGRHGSRGRPITGHTPAVGLPVRKPPQEAG